MKKVVIKISFIVVFTISLLALPKDVFATTLKQYEDQVAKYTAELQEKEAKIAKNAQEVAEIKQKIADIESQITKAEADIKDLENQIEESNQKIEEKKEESKKLMKYFQVVSNENTYLEYIFGATSITDMIYRMSVVEQLTDYNNTIMNELKQLIEENQAKKTELLSKEKELDTLKANLKDQQERIEADTSSIEGTMPSTKGQIDQYQSLVTYYKNKGCSSNDVIGVDCAVVRKTTSSTSNVSTGTVVGANGFRFPVVDGRITQGYGNNGHKGVDIGKGYGAPIYAVASGTVYYTGNTLDLSHAYMVLIVHNYNGTYVFSQYAHIQSNIPVHVGQDVDINTVIGYMGSTGNSTGPHLHLEMSTGCGWGYLCGYYQYVNHIINPFTYVPSP